MTGPAAAAGQSRAGGRQDTPAAPGHGHGGTGRHRLHGIQAGSVMGHSPRHAGTPRLPVRHHPRPRSPPPTDALGERLPAHAPSGRPMVRSAVRPAPLPTVPRSWPDDTRALDCPYGRPVGCVDASRKKFLYNFKRRPAGGRKRPSSAAENQAAGTRIDTPLACIGLALRAPRLGNLHQDADRPIPLADRNSARSGRCRGAAKSSRGSVHSA
jgi:hypothetical protein